MYLLFHERKRQLWEAEYQENEEGCYLLDVQCKDGSWVVFDATCRPKQYGCYINHDHQANARPMHFLVHVRLRVGFISTKDIAKGEEVVWDYGAPHKALNG